MIQQFDVFANPDADDASPAVSAYLRDRQMLLLLDSCEHVVEEAAAIAEQIFMVAPGVHILATSLEPLRVTGERTTFLIGPDGRIRQIWPKVKVDGHAQEVLAAAKAL